QHGKPVVCELGRSGVATDRGGLRRRRQGGHWIHGAAGRGTERVIRDSEIEFELRVRAGAAVVHLGGVSEFGRHAGGGGLRRRREGGRGDLERESGSMDHREVDGELWEFLIYAMGTAGRHSAAEQFG